MPRRGSDRGEEIRTAAALLRSIGWTGPGTLEERKITRWLHTLHRNPDGTVNIGASFELKQLAMDCDLVYYGTNRLGEQREVLHPVVRHYMQRMRDATVTFVEWFWTTPDYREWVNDGHSDERIMQKIVEVMVSYDVYPVWCDREGDLRWKLMDLDAYARIREIRGNAIASEIGQKGTEMEIMMRRFHRELPGKYARPALPRDGSFIDLPRLGPGQGIRCEVEGCGQHFHDQHALIEHALREHRDRFRRRADDNGPPTGLDALFPPGGDSR